MAKAKEKRILVLTYWPFQDALIQTYTLPYLKIISENSAIRIWLVCLQPSSKEISTLELKNIQEDLIRNRIVLLPFDYKPLSVKGVLSTALTFVNLLYLILKLKIDTIHAWATPAGALGYLLAVATRRDLIIDSYEPHAEAMIENGTWRENSMAFKVLFWLEKKQSHYARIVIAAVEGMRYYSQAKYGKHFENNFYVKPACVDIELFNVEKRELILRKSLMFEDKIVGVYAGKFSGIYLDTQFFDWLKVAISHWGDRFRLLLLTSHTKEEVKVYCEKAGISSHFIIQKFVPHHEVPTYLGLADFAITPVRPVPTKRYCTPIKDGEYWAMGLPVIITKNISDDSDIVKKHSIGYVLEDLNDDHYQASVRRMDELILDKGMQAKIKNVATRYRSFSIAREVYKKVYGSK